MPATAAITVRCACGRKLTAPAGSEGRKARCPACGASLVIGRESVPRQVPSAKAPAVANRAAANGNPISSSVATAKRPTAVTAGARAIPVAAPEPAAPAGEQNDRLQSIYEVADEMETAAPVEEVPRCPQCQASMGGGAVLCIRCGY